MRSLGLIGAVLVAALIASPAAGGGWWSYVHVEGGTVGVGETLVATSEALYVSEAAAAASRDVQYYAYLVRGFDDELLLEAQGQAEPDRWWGLTDTTELVRVGTVTTSNWSHNLGDAQAVITIPEVDTGKWSLMFCDDGCRSPLGSVIPTEIRVRPDVAAAEAARQQALAQERDEVEEQLREDLEATRAQADEAAAAAANANAALEAVQADVDDLIAAQQDTSGTPWTVLAATFAAGVAWALLAGWFAAWLRRQSMRRAVAIALEEEEDLAGFESPRSRESLTTAGSDRAGR